MKIGTATYFLLTINMALDSGNHDDITIEEVKAHIEREDLIAWLRQRLGTDTDLSLFGENGEHLSGHELVTRLKCGMNVWGGNERRKWGIENRGLCLLIAWTNEIIQQEFSQIELSDRFLTV